MRIDSDSRTKSQRELETASLARERKNWDWQPEIYRDLKVSIKLVDGTEITSALQAKSRTSINKYYQSKEFKKRFRQYEEYQWKCERDNAEREKIIEHNKILPQSFQKSVPDLIEIKSFAEWQNS